MSDKWDRRFMTMAELVSGWSKDPSSKVGAVIVRPDKTICSTGFNGFPRDVDDSPMLYHDRETKYQMVLHAEMNALLFARERVDGYTIYVTPFQPCSNCAAAIIQKRIVRVVTWNPRENMTVKQMERWSSNFEIAAQMFADAKVKVDFV